MRQDGMAHGADRTGNRYRSETLIALGHVSRVVPRPNADGDAVTEQTHISGLSFASDTSATTVYSLKVEQPM